MPDLNILWPEAYWWLIAAGFAVLLGWLAFRAKFPYPRWFRILLGLNRAWIGALLVLLASDLGCERTIAFETPPHIVFGIDNSGSVGSFLKKDTAALQSRVAEMRKRLENQGIATSITSMNGETDEKGFTFTSGFSNYKYLLSKARITDYQKGKLSALVLVGDGLNNQGEVAAADLPGVPVHTLSVGSDNALPDNAVAELAVNKMVQQQTTFPCRVAVRSYRLGPGPFNVQVLLEGRVAAERQVRFAQGQAVAELGFTLNSGPAGQKRLSVRVQEGKGEVDLRNNETSRLIKVADLKTRVLIAAPAPHPHIKAIRSALSSQVNQEVDVYIPGITEFKQKPYNILILHRLPDQALGMPEVLKTLLKGTPAWFIVAQGTNIEQLSTLAQSIDLAQGGNRYEEVNGALNPGFSRFTLNELDNSVISRFPPLTAPSALVSTLPGSEALMGQRIGRADNGKPLWLLSQTANAKEAVLLGENIWQWRIQEIAQTQESRNVDYLIQKTVQFLAKRKSGRPLECRPESEVFDEGSQPVFELRLSDQTGSPVYGNEVKISWQNTQSKKQGQNLVYADNNELATLPLLPPGSYAFKASTSINGRQATDAGTFTVQKVNLETIVNGANPSYLANLSRATGGIARPLVSAGALADSILANPPKTALEYDRKTELLREQYWLYLLMCVGLIAELVGRRMLGGI